MQQEAQRDAPDPRETRPPCYSDAIRMPRLDASFASLNEYGRGKRHRKKTENDEEVEEEVPLRRNRCRSEEVLSMRSAVAGSNRIPRIHPFEGDMRDSSNRNGRESTSESFEEIRNFNEQSATALNNRSPYAKRKQVGTNSCDNQQPEAHPAGPSTSDAGQPMEITEDHFSEVPKSEEGSIEEQEGSSEFITIKIRRQTEYILPSKKEPDDETDNGSRPTSF